ncbi:MFS transporter [Nocardioides terrisoli]|uniref:MFS transporter n=1 Tax=Nocardioides terrisoli TaxID=3388267 RepID=UPI00287B8A6C|nr:MFS transporter [Nocardioides marmorisolisilvae]
MAESEAPRATDPVQRRTLGVLVVSQALGGLGSTIGVAVAAVLAEEVSGSKALAGLVQTAQVLGAAVASFLLASLMGRHGRRTGLVVGYLVGAVGAAACVLGGAVRSFPVLLLGGLLLGANSASNYQSRYAAADLATPRTRARALAVVLWATSVGAVLGPNLTGPSGTVAVDLGLPRLTGPFAFSVVAVLLAVVVVAVALRPDPLLVARERAGQVDVVRPGTSWGRVREVVTTHPGVAAGILAISAGHAVMVAVMVMTPLHMHHGGAQLEVIGIVVSVHVLGMYFFSPLVGWAADRFGRTLVLVAGAGILLVAMLLCGTSPMGASWRIGIGLLLLGVGWSCSTVAGSAMLTESTPLAARTDVQGAADLCMNGAAAVAAALAGVVMQELGFGALNLFGALLSLGVLAAVLVARREALGVAR